MENRELIYADHAITVGPRTNRRRDAARRITRVLSGVGYERTTLDEFALLVAYTVSGDEFIWSRPHQDADEETLRRAMETFLDAVPYEYTDTLINFLFSTTASAATTPAPLPQDATPN